MFAGVSPPDGNKLNPVSFSARGGGEVDRQVKQKKKGGGGAEGKGRQVSNGGGERMQGGEDCAEECCATEAKKGETRRQG